MNHRLITLCALAATLAACGTAPERNSALEQARKPLRRGTQRPAGDHARAR